MSTGLVNGKGQILTLCRINTPQPIAKNVTGDYVEDPCCCAKFGANLSTGRHLHKWVKYNAILKKCDIFVIIWPISIIYTSFDLFLCKDVPFVDPVVTLSHLGGQIPPNPPPRSRLTDFDMSRFRDVVCLVGLRCCLSPFRDSQFQKAHFLVMNLPWICLGVFKPC